MKPDKKIDDILKRDFEVASDQDAQQAGVRVWHRLQSAAASAPDARLDKAQPPSTGSVASAFRRKEARWLQLAAAAAIVLAATIGSALLWGPADDPVYRVVEGEVYRGDPPSLLRSFGETRTIRSNGGGGAVLALSDGSRIEMRSQSELALERADDDGLRIRLHQGGIIVNAAKQRTGHLYVQTKDMTVSVVGTVFVVNADDAGSRVAVIEGEVRVQQGGTETKLRPGEHVATSAKPETFTVASELAWSRRAAELVALLQRQPAVEQQPAAGASQVTKGPRVAFEAISIRPSGPAVQIPGARGGGQGLNSRPFPSGCLFDSMGYSYQIDPRRFAVIRTTALNLVAYTIPPVLPVPENRVDSRCGLAIRMGLLSGGPDWIRTDLWDVAAAIPEGTFTRRPTLDDPVVQQMIRTMLAERFGMVLRREKKELPVYLLKVGKDGPKFNGSIPLTKDRWGGAEIVSRGPDGKGVAVADAPPPADGGITASSGSPFGPTDAGASLGQLSARNMSMTNLANYMFGFDGRPVFDRTGLTGRYDFHYADAGVQEALKKFAGRVIAMQILESNAAMGYQQGNAFFRNLLKEIGLELEESTAPFDAWVIERVERPTEN